MARLAIADPPYLGRADRWFGEGRGSGRRQVRGRVVRKPDFHPEAGAFDDPETHRLLLRRLVDEFDGFALAGHQESLALYLSEASELGCPVRVGAWCRPNSIPGGGRLIYGWEPVLFRIPEGRLAGGSGVRTRDCLVASTRPHGFLGSKPREWVEWCLLMLGHRADDEVHDLFPGSGAVAGAVHVPMDIAWDCDTPDVQQILIP